MTDEAVQQLAAKLRTAIGKGEVETALAANLADVISVHHVPPQASDGPMPRQAFIQLLQQNPILAILPDGRRSYGAPMVEGATIAFDSTLSGTTRSGEKMRITNRTILTIARGRIVKLAQCYEPSDLAAIAKLLGRIG